MRSGHFHLTACACRILPSVYKHHQIAALLPAMLGKHRESEVSGVVEHRVDERHWALKVEERAHKDAGSKNHGLPILL